MLSRDGIILRLILVLFFYFASGSGIVTGWAAGICGILGTIELVTALMGYSPLVDCLTSIQQSTEKAHIKVSVARTE